MVASIKQKWVSGLPSGFMFVLSAPKVGLPIDGLPLGKTPEEAKQAVVELNDRREKLGLETITLA